MQQRHKRVAGVLGLVGVLGALLVLTAATPTPAGADTAVNVVNITKIVNGIPDGVSSGPYEIEVRCVDPNGAANSPDTRDFHPNYTGVTGPTTLSFAANLTQCTIKEDDSRGADDVLMTIGSDTATITVGTNPPFGGSCQQNPGIVLLQQCGTILFDAGGGQSANAFVVNNWRPVNPNVVRVTKTVTGTAPPGAIFEVTVTCDAGTGGPVAVLFDGAGGTKDALLPSTCTRPAVQETVAQPLPISRRTNWTTPTGGCSPAPANAANVVASLCNFAVANPQTVTITNRYPAGPANTITVTKRLRGVFPPNGTYTVRVSCTEATGDPDTLVPSTYNDSFVFPAAGGTHVFNTPRDYASCVVWEDIPAPAPTSTDSQAFPPGTIVCSGAQTPCSTTQAGIPGSQAGSLTILEFPGTGFPRPGGQAASVTITNRYPGNVNVVRVTKRTTGPVPAGSLFLVKVSCNGDTNLATIPAVEQDRFLLFGGNNPTTQEVLVLGGTTCGVTETNSDGAAGVSYAGQSDTVDFILINQPTPPITSVNPSPCGPGGPSACAGAAWLWQPFGGPPTPGGDIVDVTITNRFNTKRLPDNVLRIKKQLRGRIPAGSSFAVRVACSGGGLTDTWNLTFTTNSFQEINVPANRPNCRITEPGALAPGQIERVFIASSATADTAGGNTQGVVNFADTNKTGGERGKVIVRNRFADCPGGQQRPKFC